MNRYDFAARYIATCLLQGSKTNPNKLFGVAVLRDSLQGQQI